MLHTHKIQVAYTYPQSCKMWSVFWQTLSTETASDFADEQILIRKQTRLKSPKKCLKTHLRFLGQKTGLRGGVFAAPAPFPFVCLWKTFPVILLPPQCAKFPTHHVPCVHGIPPGQHNRGNPYCSHAPPILCKISVLQSLCVCLPYTNPPQHDVSGS